MRSQVRWWQRTLLVEHDARAEAFEVDLDLADALARLRRPERVAVVLVHAHGWSYGEVADVLGVTVAAVTNHVHRGLQRLRAALEDG